MNDLIRPTLYDAWHSVEAVNPRQHDVDTLTYDIVGPICASADWLARNRSLALPQGDLPAILSAGAYAVTMASQYNTRPRAAAIMLDRDQVHVVRDRKSTCLKSIKQC